MFLGVTDFLARFIRLIFRGQISEKNRLNKNRKRGAAIFLKIFVVDIR